jgi:hypothetical protein
MFRRSSLALAAMALSLSIAACGGDDDKSDTTVSESSTTAVVIPAHDVAAKDGARAHSEADVYECSSMDLEGDVGSAAFGGFQDISVRGISCETGRERILEVDDTYEDGNVAADVDGYSCDVIERYDDGFATIRCVAGDDAFRFTLVPAKKKKHVELVSECGTFGRYYDVSVRNQDCQAAASFLESTPASQLTGISQGKQVAVGAENCTTLYVEGNDRTIRCTQGNKAMRFSVATKPSTSHPKKYVENPKESSQSVETSVKKVKPATKHGLSPVVTISCTSTGPYTAITARGINCAAATTLLTQNQTAIEAMERGADPLKLTGGGNFTCARIDNGGQVETAQCVSRTSGATFRASFASQSAQPSGNPPATTTPDVGAATTGAATGGGASAQDSPTTTPDTPTSSPDAATTAPDATE